MKAVHWFMLLFHEQTFRRRYEDFLAHGIRSKADSNFYKLLLVVCVLGCQYLDKRVASDLGFDVVGFQETSLRYLEANLLSLCEDTDLASVQICVLLGSFYLYTGRPNLGFVVLGSGIRCAYALGLHRENSWPRLKEEDTEERRRVWWALFIFDRYASIIYGHPCGIREGEFNVSNPRNLDDTTQTHSHGTAMSNDQSGPEAVTLFTYVIFKIELYRLSSPVLVDLYFHPNQGHRNVSQTVRDLDTRLCRWRETLPMELRLAVVGKRTSSISPPDTTFLLQALALQVAYDNILILLHRPLLQSRGAPPQVSGRSQGTAYPVSPPREATSDPHVNTQFPSVGDTYSRDRCLESASRSASLCDMKHCLIAARSTHAVAYLGINLFTAGIVLCTVALSSPLSVVAQQAKNDIRKIMIISDMFKSDSPIAPQTKQILSALVKIILDKELEALTCTEPTSSRRASPLRNIGSAQEYEARVKDRAPIPPPVAGTSSRQSQDIGATSSTSTDFGISATPNDSTFPSAFDIDMITGINSLQDSE